MEGLNPLILQHCERLGMKVFVPDDTVMVKIRGIEFELAKPLAAFYRAFDACIGRRALYFDKYNDGWPSTRLSRSLPEYSDQYQATKNCPYFGFLEDEVPSLYLLRADDCTSDPMVYYLDHDDFSREEAHEEMLLSRFLEKLLSREEANQFLENDAYSTIVDIALAVAVGEKSPREITELTVDSDLIEEITGLDEYRYLTRLSLRNNKIVDISPLKNLTMLTDLCLEQNAICDISCLGNLKNLERLKLGRNCITDISALKGMSALKELSIKHNKITDASPVYTLDNLEKLEIEEELLDFDKLNLMPSLKTLNNRK